MKSNFSSFNYGICITLLFYDAFISFFLLESLYVEQRNKFGCQERRIHKFTEANDFPLSE